MGGGRVRARVRVGVRMSPNQQLESVEQPSRRLPKAAAKACVPGGHSGKPWHHRGGTISMV